jgi:hypothetical protein
MIVTAFEVEGTGVRNGNFAIGSELIYTGLHEDPWYYGFIVIGKPKYLFYFTENCIISVSEGMVKRYNQVDVLRIPFIKSCLFFEQDRDNPEDMYSVYISNTGVRSNYNFY